MPRPFPCFLAAAAIVAMLSAATAGLAAGGAAAQVPNFEVDPTGSKGNIYTTETYNGARLQRFLYEGTGPVKKAVQGPPGPSR